jgi:hypothetical protein
MRDKMNLKDIVGKENEWNWQKIVYNFARSGDKLVDAAAEVLAISVTTI